MRGPTTPVCQIGTPCSEPARGAVLNFFTPGASVGAGIAFVKKNGAYSVSLAPGVYSVTWVYFHAGPPVVGRGIEPATVRVVAGQNRRVDFRIDTGIR